MRTMTENEDDLKMIEMIHNVLYDLFSHIVFLLSLSLCSPISCPSSTGKFFNSFTNLLYHPTNIPSVLYYVPIVYNSYTPFNTTPEPKLDCYEGKDVKVSARDKYESDKNEEEEQESAVNNEEECWMEGRARL
jgi:hypothetical protein